MLLTLFRYKVFSLRAGHFESDRFERTDLGNEIEHYRKYSCARSGFLITVSPLLLILSTRQVVKELLLSERRVLFYKLISFGKEGNPGHLRNDGADGAPKGRDRQINAGENVCQLDAVGLKERTLKDGLRHAEANEIMIGIGCVPVLGHLHDIKAEFRSNGLLDLAQR